MTLRSKFFATLFLTAGIPLILGLFTSILLGKQHLVDEEGRTLTEKAASISAGLKFSIYQEIDYCHAWSNDQAMQRSFDHSLHAASNHPFSSMAHVTVDEEWSELDVDHPNISFYLTNAVSQDCKAFQQVHRSLKEVLITDAQGRLLSASNKSSDYWQADESWWQQGFALDRSSVLVEGIHYDDSAGIQSLDVIVPIYLPGADSPAGVIKSVLDISPVIESMGNMLRNSEQDTMAVLPGGQILLATREGADVELESVPDASLSVLFEPAPGWEIMDLFLGAKAFVSHAPLKLAGNTVSRNRVLGASQLSIVASRPYADAISPINRQVRLLLIAGALTILLLLFLGDRIVLHSVIHPIQRLRKATEQITWTPVSSSIDPTYRKQTLETIEDELNHIRSKDEIRELAGAFETMATRIYKNEDALLGNQRLLESEVASQTAELKDVNQDLHVHRDKLQKAVLDLKAKNQDLEAFAYSVSHDLKAPLRAIGSISDWLHTDYIDVLDEKGQSLVLLLQQRVIRLERLIDGILEYSRAGRVSEETRVQVGQLLHEILQTLEIQPHITVTLQDDYPTITGNPSAIGQIFQNLIGNAVKYIDKSRGEVHVTSRYLESEWEFSVSDNGPGIDAKYHSRVFKLFNTLNARDDVEGSGIGLSLVKRQVDSHGGKIWIESNGSVGSVFKFTWPDRGVLEE